MEALPLQLTDFAATPNLVRLFLDRADERSERPFLVAKADGTWQLLSWRENAEQVCVLAEALRGLGLEAGDRKDDVVAAAAEPNGRSRISRSWLRAA